MTSPTVTRARWRTRRDGVVRGGTVVPTQGVSLCLGMLRGAFATSQAGLLLAALVSMLAAGRVAALNSLVASVLVVLFFASGQAVQLVAGEMADSTAMVLLVGSYLVRVALLGVCLVVAMSRQDQLESWFVRPAFMAGALAALAGWLGGIFVAHSRQHVYVYDRDHDAARMVGGPR